MNVLLPQAWKNGSNISGIVIAIGEQYQTLQLIRGKTLKRG